MTIDYRILLFCILLIQKSYALDCQTCSGNLPSYLTEFDEGAIKKLLGGLADKICIDSKNIGTTKTCEPGSVCYYFVILLLVFCSILFLFFCRSVILGRDFGAPAAFLGPLVAIFGICAKNHAQRWYREPLASSLGLFSKGRQKSVRKVSENSSLQYFSRPSKNSS